jgi:hypothetical protein
VGFESRVPAFERAKTVLALVRPHTGMRQDMQQSSQDFCDMTQRKEHSWNELDYENRRTPIWVMMLTSASCCRDVQQDPACSFSVRQDSDISTIKYLPHWTTSCHQLEKMWKDADTYYFGVRTRVWITNETRLRLLSHILMLILTQLVCDSPQVHCSPCTALDYKQFSLSASFSCLQ